MDSLGLEEAFLVEVGVGGIISRPDETLVPTSAISMKITVAVVKDTVSASLLGTRTRKRT